MDHPFNRQSAQASLRLNLLVTKVQKKHGGERAHVQVSIVNLTKARTILGSLTSTVFRLKSAVSKTNTKGCGGVGTLFKVLVRQ